MTNTSDEAPADGIDNCVFLRGCLAAEPETRTLAGGEEVVAFRLTVSRPVDGRSTGRGGRADTIDCATTQSKARRALQRAAPGDQLEVTGALHRRFWRSAGGVASRYEVAADTVRVARGARRVSRRAAAASPDPTPASA